MTKFSEKVENHGSQETIAAVVSETDEQNKRLDDLEKRVEALEHKHKPAQQPHHGKHKE